MAAASKTAAQSAATGPVLLTVTGAVQRTNRGPIDKALDQMMAKQQLVFDKAYTFDFAALTRLPALEIKPTLEYDGKVHTLRGPLLADVLKAVGTPTAADTPLALRAIDGYVTQITLDDVVQQRMLIATHLDGKPMPLGGLGPLWAVIDADRLPALAAKPLDQRFAQCPWGIFHIAVGAAG